MVKEECPVGTVPVPILITTPIADRTTDEDIE